jgi:saccharopine dehydrogenase (NAD+, L-lysine forming)
MLHLGVIKEGKVPTDRRVLFSPKQCVYLRDQLGLRISVQASGVRCYQDSEYISEGFPAVEHVNDAQCLLGIKEVPIEMLHPEKTYCFFSHTIKKQPYNRKLLQAVIEKGIRLIDYEVITDERGGRLIAFGHFAGMVGAHNGIYAYGRKTGLFSLPRMNDCHDYQEVKKIYQKILIPPIKVVLTGGGRVSTGAAQVLKDMGFTEKLPRDFVSKQFSKPVFTQIHAADYARRKDGRAFDKLDYYTNSEHYVSAFEDFYRAADVMINGIFYDGKAPMFFTREEMLSPDFKIKTLADITCDIMPGASVPCTIMPSTIDDPVYGYDAATNTTTTPYQSTGVDVMAIDNLPSELPRDSSEYFGGQFIKWVLPELITTERSPILERATIAEKGKLGKHFTYLSDYLAGEEP